MTVNRQLSVGIYARAAGRLTSVTVLPFLLFAVQRSEKDMPVIVISKLHRKSQGTLRVRRSLSD